MPSRFDGECSAATFPASRSRWTGSSTRSRRIDGEILGDLEIVRIPPICIWLATRQPQWLTRGRATTRSPAHGVPRRRLGIAPVLQSISLGFECAMYLRDYRAA